MHVLFYFEPSDDHKINNDKWQEIMALDSYFQSDIKTELSKNENRKCKNHKFIFLAKTFKISKLFAFWQKTYNFKFLLRFHLSPLR